MALLRKPNRKVSSKSQTVISQTETILLKPYTKTPYSLPALRLNPGLKYSSDRHKRHGRSRICEIWGKKQTQKRPARMRWRANMPRASTFLPPPRVKFSSRVWITDTKSVGKRMRLSGWKCSVSLLRKCKLSEVGGQHCTTLHTLQYK